MNTVFTQEELVKFLFKETTEMESQLIEEALIFDHTLKLELEEMKSLLSLLPSVEMKPKESTMNNILNYSKAHSARSTSIGMIDLVLN